MLGWTGAVFRIFLDFGKLLSDCPSDQFRVVVSEKQDHCNVAVLPFGEGYLDGEVSQKTHRGSGDVEERCGSIRPVVNEIIK